GVLKEVAAHLGNEEDHEAEHEQEHHDADQVVHGVVRVERNTVQRNAIRTLVLLDLDAVRVVGTHFVQRQQVQYHQGDQDDRQCHDVQGKEAVEGGTGDQVVTTHPHQQVFADDGNCPHQRHDHVGTPVGHLAPGQYVAHEALDDQHQVDGHAEYPDQLTWLLVGTVHQPAEHVQVDDDEEGRGPGGVQIAQQPAPFHVAHDVLDRGEGAFG